MAAVMERLTDEEAYLAVILQDRSGLDIAEFSWADEEGPDGCFRAWPYQWTWWRSASGLQIDQCGRSVGKSLSIEVRAFAFPFVWPSGEMAITAPEGIHIDLITDKIETRFDAVRLGREMVKLAAGRVAKHKPFQMNFVNGARIVGRIPQRDGRGVKGIHPVVLELDEAQDYPDKAWTELRETLRRGVEGAMWRAHGVTRGVQDDFWKLTQDTSGWKVHRYTAMHKPPPHWSDEERSAKISEYGSRDDPGYRRNVLGMHGDATNPLFVLHRFMRCVDTDRGSAYNTEEYWRVTIKDEMVEDAGGDILNLLDLRRDHIRQYKNGTFWIGADIGFTRDPTEILIFVEYTMTAAEVRACKNARPAVAVPDEGLTRLKLIGRVTLKRIGGPQQVDVFEALINHYNPMGFGMDKTGNGLPLFQMLQDRVSKNPDLTISEARRRLAIVKGYNFSEKVLVDFDQSIEVDEEADIEEQVKEAGIVRHVLEYSTDLLRDFVDTKRWLLPWEEDESPENLIKEFTGQTYTFSKTEMDAYGRRRIFSKGTFHALDAARMFAMTQKQHAIEELTSKTKEPTEPIYDSFVSA